MQKLDETPHGKVLDISEYEINSLDDLVAYIRKRCNFYHLWTPRNMPDIVLLSPQQRALVPREIEFFNTPHNVMEIQVKGRA